MVRERHYSESPWQPPECRGREFGRYEMTSVCRQELLGEQPMRFSLSYTGKKNSGFIGDSLHTLQLDSPMNLGSLWQRTMRSSAIFSQQLLGAHPALLDLPNFWSLQLGDAMV
jgi:hypothetical protein